MKYIVRQRFSYTGPDGNQISVRTGDIIDTEIVATWRNGGAMMRAGFIAPHDDVQGITPSAELSVQRTQKKRGRARKET